MLFEYSVLPLTAHKWEERAQAILRDVQRGAYSTPLFSMNLVPEGNPVWDKVEALLNVYEHYPRFLQAAGISCGILVQASLGHGYPLTKAPFQQIVAVADGEPIDAYCPSDPAFLAHFADIFRRLAKRHPSVLMLDDDFRLLMRPAKGCLCPRHLQAFNRKAGTHFTKELLQEHLLTHPKTDPLSRIFVQTQRDALCEAARVFRAAIDEIDPTIQGINCTSGDLCEAVDGINKIFAGTGNPTVVRIPNGSYAPLSSREFSHTMRQTAVCSSRLKARGIDVLLAETDTVPFNRYGKSARYLHAQYTASIWDGLAGAKHWLTRLSAHEPKSGDAYREIFIKHRGFYEKLHTLVQGMRPMGAASLFLEQQDFDFSAEDIWKQHPNRFVTRVLERMGIPFYFTDRAAPALFAEAHILEDLSDDAVKDLFDGSVFLDGIAAEGLSARGFDHLLGGSVCEWDGQKVSAECFDEDGYVCCTKQKYFRKLIPAATAQTLSFLIRRENGRALKLAPAVTVFPRENGRLTTVFCGSPDTDFVYTEGFSFLNETRKAQLISLLTQADALPVYMVGDDEVCLRAGLLTDGRLLVACFPLGFDPIEQPRFFFKTPPADLCLVSADGTEQPIAFSKTQDGSFSVAHRLEPMTPAVFVISPAVNSMQT